MASSSPEENPQSKSLKMVNYRVAIFTILYVIQMTTCNEVDNGLNTTPSESEKRSRFIAFDSEHGEVKVELDFAVPFLKIPLGTKRSGGHILEPLLEVNSRGLVTVATMIFLFITIIPKIVKLFIPHAHVSTTDGLMPLMSRIDEALHSMDIPSTECYQRSACWFGSSTSNLINTSNFSNTRSSECE
nr:uncharacterized protein LOC112210762 [Halyomorpha halys]